ncbi:GTP-binding protein 2 [Daktulosphaira vitifoliae]|uniref:GTP-binding protein 2 n=1 Tax=Daktulosphaira vitifoliae TaxID=58002 RepID=UPI0021AAA2B1|nr:GTP-binding protein 2 [Daktulosphaira vitifoliae]
MDSFLDLFDPGSSSLTSCDVWPEDDALATHLPPEPQMGNVEYKLKLINPSKLRFEHLVTQLKWRLREGHGEAIYEIGVEDTGMLTGLSIEDMESSLITLDQMASKLGATTSVLRERMVGKDKMVAEILVRKVPDDQECIEVMVAVLGGVDAGKSTLLGVLAHGENDNGRGSARLNVLRHLHELRSGRTSSISHEILGFDIHGEVINYQNARTAEEIRDRSTKLITFLDLAGHKKYLKTTVAGLSGYCPHQVMLVVSSPAVTTSSSIPLNMTKEHMDLALALRLPFCIVVTKTDITPADNTLNWLECILKAVGNRKVPLVVKSEDDVITASSSQQNQNVVPIFTVSSVTGEGLDLLIRFLYVLPPSISLKEKERLEQECCQFQIDEIFKVPDIGTIVGGVLTQGVINIGTELVIGPFSNGKFVPVTIQSIHRNKAPCRVVKATQSASLSLEQSIPGLRNGMVLLGLGVNHQACMFFQARIVVLYHATSIHNGFQTTVHIGNIRQTAAIVAIMDCDKNGMHTNDTASVIFKFARHPEYVTEGMRLLFREGQTKGIGRVTQVFAVQVEAG